MSKPVPEGNDPHHDWRDALLRYWFEELGPAGWFARSDDTDATLARRFADVPALASAAYRPGVATTGREVLAAIIALDQLPRNLHRGRPQAFEHDARALALAEDAIGRGLDSGMDPAERLFLYLPFEHCEDAAIQARSVALFTTLGNVDWLDYAVRHKAVIERFGRFPHRNAALGRSSTAEELAYLAEPGSGF